MNVLPGGGPAFPTPADGEVIDGLTKRDWFARAALEAMIPHTLRITQDAEGGTMVAFPNAQEKNDFAIDAYGWADAMLRARSVT